VIDEADHDAAGIHIAAAVVVVAARSDWLGVACSEWE